MQRQELGPGLRRGDDGLEVPENRQRHHDRIIWSADAQGRVRQSWEASIDAGSAA